MLGVVKHPILNTCTKVFAKWLLGFGEGNIGGSNFEGRRCNIDMPKNLLIIDSFDPIVSLMEFL